MLRKNEFAGSNRTKKLSKKAVIFFTLTLTLCSLMVFTTVLNRSNVEKMAMEQLISGRSVKINEVISKLLFKTQTISTLVIQNDGQILDFERIAATVIDDPAILNVLIAPDGIVSNVYPLAGNEAVIGLNMLGEGAGNKEAVMAKERGQLVFGGPFNLAQGGQALVGRLPVYIDTPEGEKRFWGLVSVTLKFPQVLDAVDLASLETQNFSYEIWRINPDDNQRQVIASSVTPHDQRMRFIEKHIQILNADWYFRVSPIHQWYEYAETWVMIFTSLCISLLLAFTMQNNFELRLMRTKLEGIARVDMLTGIFNRYHFMELARVSVIEASMSSKNAFIIMFDIDRFKRVNDSFGHLAGDKVLKTIASRVKNTIRPYDLLARYGGEEFIMLITGVDNADLKELAEQIRLNICKTPITFEDKSITVSASFGVASATLVKDIETAIKNADKALYIAKEEGRNRVVFYDDIKEHEVHTK